MRDYSASIFRVLMLDVEASHPGIITRRTSKLRIAE
jgi:hypothetical protein